LNLQHILTQYRSSDKVNQFIEALQESKKKIHLKGLVGSVDAVLAVASHTLVEEQHFLFILSDREEAAYFQSDLENLLNKAVLFFPSSFRKNLDFTQSESTQVLQRAETLNALNHHRTKGKFIVTYPEAIAEKVPNSNSLAQHTLDISVGNKLDIEFISEFLLSYHFNRVDFVYEPGQFSVRGGIVDIFSFANDYPYRIEFFGDEIASIRTFQVDSQLSINQLTTVSILPNVQSQTFVDGSISFLDFLNSTSTIVWFKDAQFTLDVIKKSYQDAQKLWQALPQADKEQNIHWHNPNNQFIDQKNLTELLNHFSIVEFGKQFFYTPNQTVFFDTKPQPSFNKDFNLLLHNFKEHSQQHIENLIFADSAKQVERLYAIFADLDKTVTFTPIHISLREGFIDYDLKWACYTDHQIFNRYFKYKLKKSYTGNAAITLKELRELKPGDFVTHIDHGIGKYAGLEKTEINGHVQEMIRLVYADHDLLYVNINALNRITRYTGQDGTIPKLNKLGSDAWDKLKKNTKKKVKDIARDLIKLYAQRKAQTGNAFSPDTYLQNELEASFIYEDTPDQIKATADIKRDMESPHPMDRLICGDVGFGKTEIAIRAAFKSVADSKQVAILVPTTILAFQHYKTFTSRLKDLPCTIDYINRFRSTSEIKDTLKKTAEGKVDILIGTHRVVSKDVKFKDLGLLIIDEEQKFGVSTKEKLKQMRVNVDTLTLTATPIPRTLHFSLMGARDLSIISTPPPNRQPVLTELHVFNEKLIKEAVESELERDGQVFFIHNRVADIEQYAALIRGLVPHARIAVGHGQMDGEHLEDVMIKFVNGEYDVLVATTIIEAGLDIPNANTIIINHAHLFGLSDLHQMRGRVGRSNKKAFCYLLSPPLSTLTHEARKRLSAIEEFSDLGSGFNVAMRDLDIRGSGNLLGAEQSGFIAEIGFEMYQKILEEAIQELKQDEFAEVFADSPSRPYVQFTQLETDLEMLIPNEYVTNVSERYNLYAELSKLETEAQLQQFGQMLTDRFGPIPTQVAIMMNAMRLQWLGKAIGFEKLSLKKQVLKGYFIADQKSPYFDSNAFQKVLTYIGFYPTQCTLKQVKNTLRLAIEHIKNLDEAINILNNMITIDVSKNDKL